MPHQFIYLYIALKCSKWVYTYLQMSNILHCNILHTLRKFMSRLRVYKQSITMNSSASHDSFQNFIKFHIKEYSNYHVILIWYRVDDKRLLDEGMMSSNLQAFLTIINRCCRQHIDMIFSWLWWLKANNKTVLQYKAEKM